MKACTHKVEDAIGRDRARLIDCGEPAPFRDELGTHLCTEHAKDAIAFGIGVVDAAGDHVLPHPETGELAKVVTIEVCS